MRLRSNGFEARDALDLYLNHCVLFADEDGVWRLGLFDGIVVARVEGICTCDQGARRNRDPGPGDGRLADFQRPEGVFF